MSGVSMCWVVWVGGRGGGAWWLLAGGICASQGTFSSSSMVWSNLYAMWVSEETKNHHTIQ